MPLRRSIVVSGRVQGVGFRYFTQKNAAAFACTGWVRNMADGSVAMEVQGMPENVTAFTDKMHRGPALARVNNMTVVDLPIIDGEAVFAVRF